jgi:hypothetical protein
MGGGIRPWGKPTRYQRQCTEDPAPVRKSAEMPRLLLCPNQRFPGPAEKPSIDAGGLHPRTTKVVSVEVMGIAPLLGAR